MFQENRGAESAVVAGAIDIGRDIAFVSHLGYNETDTS
jgi:hypothetical protein